MSLCAVLILAGESQLEWDNQSTACLYLTKVRYLIFISLVPKIKLTYFLADNGKIRT